MLKCSLLVYPNKCSLNVIAINDESMRNKSVEFWDNVYGRSLSAINSLTTFYYKAIFKIDNIDRLLI